MSDMIRRQASGILYMILAASLALCVLAASSGYAEATSLSDTGSSVRVMSQFLRTKIRQGDVFDAISVLDDGYTLRIREEYPEGVFYTSMYYYDGWLMEQLAVDGLELMPEMGDKIIACDGAYFELDGDILTAVFNAGTDREQNVIIRLRSGAGS